MTCPIGGGTSDPITLDFYARIGRINNSDDNHCGNSNNNDNQQCNDHGKGKSITKNPAAMQALRVVSDILERTDNNNNNNSDNDE